MRRSWKLLLIAVVLLFAMASLARAEKRIAGIPAEGEWPQFVAFSDQATDLFNRCAGVLVRPRWVLTAPNGCLDDRRDDTQAFVGATQSDPYDGVRRAIDQVYLHPRYNQDQGDWDINPVWNIGLVRLRQPLRGVPPVSLATRKPAIGSRILSVGLGNNKLEGYDDVYPELLQSEVDVVPASLCERYLPGQSQGHRSLFCAWTPDQGPCTLDEGTGAFQGERLVGLFNLVWNGQTNPACPEALGAGYYSAVGPARPWIRAVLGRGFAPGRFIDYGAYIFPDREINLYLWVNQEVSGGQIRLSERACFVARKCIRSGRWIDLRDNLVPGSRRGNYWMNRKVLRVPDLDRCLRGQVRVRFDGQGKPAVRHFRSCMKR